MSTFSKTMTRLLTVTRIIDVLMSVILLGSAALPAPTTSEMKYRMWLAILGVFFLYIGLQRGTWYSRISESPLWRWVYFTCLIAFMSTPILGLFLKKANEFKNPFHNVHQVTTYSTAMAVMLLNLSVAGSIRRQPEKGIMVANRKVSMYEMEVTEGMDMSESEDLLMSDSIHDHVSTGTHLSEQVMISVKGVSPVGGCGGLLHDISTSW